MTDSPFPGSPPLNPYAPPAAASEQHPFGAPGDPEAIRHAFIKHEAAIRALGFLYLFAAALFALTALAIAFTVLLQVVFPSGPKEDWPVGSAMLVFTLGIVVLQVWVGRGLRRLDRKVRRTAIVLSAIGLLGFPLGTLANAYFLYLLAGEKGSFVLSPAYQEVVAATPQMRYVSPWLIVALVTAGGLVLLLIVAAIASS